MSRMPQKIVRLPDGTAEYVDDWDEIWQHESPIETEMHRLIRNAFDENTTIIPQCEIGRYRVDFALRIMRPSDMAVVVIECDGEEFHRNYFKEIARERDLKNLGVHRIIRFTWSDIFSRPDETLLVVKNTVIAYGGKLK